MPTIDVKYQLQQGTGRTGEPVRANAWEVEIPALGPVALFASEFTAPAIDIETLEVRHYNEVTKIAGKVKVEGASLKIRDVLDPDMHAAVTAWQKRVYDAETAELGFASDYKEMGFARRYDSKGTLVRTLVLHGLWPTKPSQGDFNYDKWDGNILEVALSCDYFLIEK